MNRLWYVIVITALLVPGTLARSHYHVDQKHPGTNVGPEQEERNPEISGPDLARSHVPKAHQADGADRHYHPRRGALSPTARAQHTGVDWMQRGKDELNIALNVWPKWKPARNVIYFIGDGMGVTTQTAGRIFKAQREGKSVTEAKLGWEEFPYAGVIKTYNTDRQAPDSAGTATAFASGEKTRSGVLGVNENVRRGNCSQVAGNELRSIVHYAQDDNKWAGVVSTAGITGATPAAVFAHAAERNWEADVDVPAEDQETCWDIARQLVHSDDNKILRVVLAGGRKPFRRENETDPEHPESFGRRKDGRNLIQEWLDIKSAMGLAETEYKYVENKTDFDNVDTQMIQYLFGLFEDGKMKYETDRLEETGDTWTEPSLAEMVKKSLDILKRGPDGYILFVEGAQIDNAHHANNAYRAFMDLVALQDAVEVAANETDEEDTLIVLTADHSHTLTMAGYPKLDNDILGLAITQDDELEMGTDFKPYLTLGYANGPGYKYHRSVNGTVEGLVPRTDLTNHTTTGKDFLQDGPVPTESETHSGEDVAIFARGPMAHLFSGQHEQHYIAHAAMYAACLGWNKDLCENNPPPPGEC